MPNNEKNVSNNYKISLEELSKVDSILNESYSFWGTLVLSFGIVLREALEAGLVLMLLFSILNSLEAKRAVRWVNAGWLLAVGLGGLSYFLVEKFVPITGELAETMEGIIGLIAVGLLFYVGFWFILQGRRFRIWPLDLLFHW